MIVSIGGIPIPQKPVTEKQVSKDKRNEQICLRFAAGDRLEAIANAYDISIQRVAQLIHRWCKKKFNRKRLVPCKNSSEGKFLHGTGYDRMEGERVKLGYTIDRSTIRNLLKRHHLLPAPKRRPKSIWRTFLRY